MPLRDHWWCIPVAKYGAFLITIFGAYSITDYRGFYRYVWYDNTAVDRSSGDKKSGYAVRCIKTQFVP